MQGPVVDVAAHRFTVSFLLVADEVFCTSLDAGILHALDGIGHCDSGQVRVGGKAFPVTASVGILPCVECKPVVQNPSLTVFTYQSASNRCKLNMDTNTLCFGPHGITAGVNERRVPSGCYMNTRGEHSHALDVANAIKISLLIDPGPGCAQLTSEDRLEGKAKGIRY